MLLLIELKGFSIESNLAFIGGHHLVLGEQKLPNGV
jgi:hypothetical protein